MQHVSVDFDQAVTVLHDSCDIAFVEQIMSSIIHKYVRLWGRVRISTHADPTRGQRSVHIGQRMATRRPARMARLPYGVPIVLSLMNTLFDPSDFGLLGELLGSKVSENVRFLPRTQMNHRAKFDAASFIPGGEIRNRTNQQTNKHTNSK